jgi:hypothetical protein
MNFLETNEDPIDYKDVLLSYEHCLRDVNELVSIISILTLVSIVRHRRILHCCFFRSRK